MYKLCHYTECRKHEEAPAGGSKLPGGTTHKEGLVSEVSVGQGASKCAPERGQASPLQTRQGRATALVLDHAREIAESAHGALYKVPNLKGTYYVVSLSRGSCECADHSHRGVSCKHLLAAEIVAAKVGYCAECNGRRLWRDLHEVGDDHLCFFEGDVLCRQCALSHGVL